MYIFRFKHHSFLAALALWVVVVSARAQEPAPSLDSLEGLVAQGSQLRLTLAQEERSFAEQKRQWLSEIALLTQEAATLQKTIDETKAHSTEDAPERLALIQERDRLTQMAERLPDLLARAESDLILWQKRIPGPQRATLQHVFDRLPADDATRKTRSNNERLQTIISLYSEIEKLESHWFVGKEMISFADGTRREMDVCYLGLARAFAVSGDNAVAAVGIPTLSGWDWTPQNDLAVTVRKAIEVFHRHEAAQWVHFPLQTTGGTQ